MILAIPLGSTGERVLAATSGASFENVELFISREKDKITN
jgi:hypothetical protein